MAVFGMVMTAKKDFASPSPTVITGSQRYVEIANGIEKTSVRSAAPGGMCLSFGSANLPNGIVYHVSYDDSAVVRVPPGR